MEGLDRDYWVPEHVRPRRAPYRGGRACRVGDARTSSLLRAAAHRVRRGRRDRLGGGLTHGALPVRGPLQTFRGLSREIDELPLVYLPVAQLPLSIGRAPTNGYHLSGCTWGNGLKYLRKVARRTRNIKHDRCRTPNDSTAKDEHSDHNRTIPATRQAPAWAPFAFRGLSCELRHAAHGRFVKARPARPTSTRLRSRRARQAPSGGSIVAQTKRHTVSCGVLARCRTGRLEEPWQAQPNAPRPRTTGAATNG